jgi:hypothetical protein
MMISKLLGRLSLTALFAVGLTFSSAADASTIYDLTLTPIFGGVSGTGTLTVEGTHGFDVTSLDITMADGVTFDFNPDDVTARINGKGKLVGLRGFDIDDGAALFLDYRYALFFDDDVSTLDRISAMDPPAATPLPATWTLMLIGVLSLAFFAYRGQRSHVNPRSPRLRNPDQLRRGER